MPQKQNAVLDWAATAKEPKITAMAKMLSKREGEFDEVTGEELEGFLLAPPSRQRAGKKEGQGEPEQAPAQRLPHLHRAGAALKDAQVQRQAGRLARINPAQCQGPMGMGAAMNGAQARALAPEASSMTTCEALLGRSPLCHHSTSALAM